MRARLGRFCTEFGERPLAEIGTGALEGWLQRLDVGEQSLVNYRRVVGGLFNFGMKRGWCGKNPASAVEMPRVDETMPAFLTAKSAEALLRTAEAEEPKMAAYFALGLFAGLRPSNELRGLRWENVDLEEGELRVDPATSKRRRTRIVTVGANLKAWLRRYGGTEGPVFYSRRAFRRVVASSGVEWSVDVMRHTFATFHLAMWGDAAKTSLQLGHSGAPSVLFNHYRGLARKKEAERFWGIGPGG